MQVVEADIIRKLKSWTVEQSLPLWANAGWNDHTGKFVERLKPDGTADYDAPLRVRVQARQIYVFAKAAHLGWFPGGAEIALKGLAFMLKKAKSKDGGYVHMLTRDGEVLDAQRDTYDQAFVLLALATAFQLTGDPGIRTEIDSLVAFFDLELRNPHGGFIESLPPALPRRQNPHMHAFEAMVALYEATGDDSFRMRSDALFDIFRNRLFNEQTETLGEYFQEDWTPVNPNPVEPGHQAEWVWLLQGFQRITGRDTTHYRNALMKSALRYSEETTGCLVDEGDDAGNMTKLTRRLWPQTEIAKAWIALAEAGDSSAVGEARDALARLDQHYLQHPVNGGWYDQFDGNGRSLVEFIPASSFYHIMCAVIEADRVIRQ